MTLKLDDNTRGRAQMVNVVLFDQKTNREDRERKDEGKWKPFDSCFEY